MIKHKRGFTLVEILIVLAIVSILSAFGFASFSEARKSARDTERKADLQALQSALDLYKLKNGRYPAGCNTVGTWSGQLGTGYACSNGTGQYIVGLAPEFISVLPLDPRLNGASSGYVYVTNDEGTVYKIMAENTVESEVIDPSHSFSRCTDTNDGSTECASQPSDPTGNNAYNTAGSAQNQCTNPSIFNNDYAVVGGYAAGGNWGGVYRTTERAREYFSDLIRCK